MRIDKEEGEQGIFPDDTPLVQPPDVEREKVDLDPSGMNSDGSTSCLVEGRQLHVKSIDGGVLKQTCKASFDYHLNSMYVCRASSFHQGSLILSAKDLQASMIDDRQNLEEKKQQANRKDPKAILQPHHYQTFHLNLLRNTVVHSSGYNNDR